MAAARKVKDHYLTCSICTDVFTSPCTLSCDHTFCQDCLTKYTKTQHEAVKAKCLPCACCRQFTKVPHPEKQLEEWASQMKPNFLIQGLMDDFGPGTYDAETCSPCHDEGKTTPATVGCQECDAAYCEGCLKHHNRIPGTRHHEVCRLQEQGKVKKRRKFVCKVHPQSKIELFCKDCRKALCNTCCNLNHRSCKTVVALESMLSEVKSVLTETDTTCTSKTQQEETKIAEWKSRINKITESSRSAIAEIRVTSQKVVDLVRENEKQLTDEIREKQIGQLKARMKSAEMAIQICQQHSEFIKQAMMTESQLDMFDMYESCGSGVVEAACDTHRDLETEPSVDRIQFRGHFEKVKETLSDVQLGEIDVVLGSGFGAEKSPVLHDTIHVKTKGDNKNPDPVDVLVMAVKGVRITVVIDYVNCSVKSFFTKNKTKCHSRVKVKSNPWNLTKLQSYVIAVTVPHARQILTMKVKPKLKPHTKISTRKKYFGLTSLWDSTLAAGCKDPPSVDILDMAGNVLRSITSLSTGQKLIQSPAFLSTTAEGNILVSDCGSKSVICMTSTGDDVFRYSPTGDREIKFARGITSTSSGEMLLVDRLSNKVIQLSASGEFMRDVLTSHDGLEMPYGVYCEDQNLLYVTQTYNNIMIFAFN